MNRLYNLDYLRGLAAFAIMVYHYISWTYGKMDASTFLGRLGIYGVSIFYILSGLTLYFVYSKKETLGFDDLRDFFQKRLFRIFPLLWLATFLHLLLGRDAAPATISLNLTGMFGIFAPNDYIATGAWSIGNELVFYLFFPLFIVLLRYAKPLFWALSVLLTGLYVYFAFFVLDSATPLTDQWPTYINPLNQVFLFLSGVLMGVVLQSRNVSNATAATWLIAGLVLFIALPATGNHISIVTGWNRLLFTFAGILICTGFFKLNYQLPNFLHKPLAILGEASYSLYLLHPLVSTMVHKVLGKVGIHNPLLTLVASAVASVVVSYWVFLYFEKYFIRLGKKVDVVRTAKRAMVYVGSRR